jgi:hypothetical protein
MAVGFGTDIWCLDSLQPGRFARGNVLLAQAVYRRWTTPRGTLRGGPEEANYGIDVAGYVGAVGPATAVAALPGIMRAEALKDDRVADVEVAAAWDQATETLTLSAVIVPADGRASFPLTLAVDAVGVELIGGMPS